MKDPTTPPNPDAIIITVDVTAALDRLARLITRDLVARAAAEDAAANGYDRNGPYDPGMDRYAVTIAEHGLGEHRTRIRRVGEGYEVRCSCGGLDAGASDAGLAERLAAEHRRQA